MPLHSILNRLATAVTLCSHEDEASLKELAEGFEELAAELGDPSSSFGEAVAQAVACAKAMLASESQDPEQDLRLLEQIVTWAQDAADALDAGQEVTPFGAASEEQEGILDEADQELLGMFLGSAMDALNSIEAELLELERDPEQPDRAAEVRGVLHTLKGECGVIPLPDAQSLLHLAESALDRATACGGAVPADLLLELVDWMKGYVESLADGLDGASGGSEELRERLEAVATGKQEAEAETAKAESTKAESTEAEPIEERAPQIDPNERISFPDEILEDPTLPEFLSEARSHIEDSEAALLEVEEDPSDTELIDRIFRGFHTIKGVAGFMDMGDMVALAHSSETLLDAFRKARMQCTASHTTLIFEACDSMTSMLEYLSGSEPPLRRPVYELIDRLERCTAGGEPETALEETSQGAADEQTSAEVVEATEVPVPEERPLIGKILVDQGYVTSDALEAALESQRSQPKSPTMAKIGSILVSCNELTQENLDAALAEQAAMSGEPQSQEPEDAPEAQAPPSEGPGGASKPAPQAPANAPDASRSRKRARIEHTVKVATHRLDTLVDMVGELVIAQQMVTQDPELGGLGTPRLQRNLGQVGKITRDLQESAMSLRMVTLRSTFQKMTRLARDVSAKAGKSVSFMVAGEETELDRNVVEEIGDPLVHLIRNAIDRGLEPPDERVEKNKPPKGQVELTAYHQGGSIVIEIRDDGRGMSRERLIDKAIERGILPADMSRDEMPDSEVWKLIFHPGFSTAEKVTDISGRGVGMDVVRRNIESMRGKIEVESTTGEGTAIYLRLPLTLAIIDGMVVRVGSQRYVIPTLAIEQSFRPDPTSCHRVMHDGRMVEVRGRLLPVHRLEEAFDLERTNRPYEEGILVLVEAIGQRACLFVDEILGQQQVVIKNLGKALPPTPGMSGGAILGDGRVALILDVDALLNDLSQVNAA